MAGDTSASRTTAQTSERPRLLLAEDDAGLRRSLQLLFRARGFDVRAYASGAALLADPLARAACCVVADYQLDEIGGIDGIEVLARLRESGWSGPAVLITGFATSELAARARAQGFAQVLEKPFREHALGSAIARLTGIGKPDALA